MSWNIVLLDADGHASVETMPKDFHARAIGTRSEVFTQISQLFGSLIMDGESHGILMHGDGSLEIFLGQADPCESIHLSLRAGSGALAPISILMMHFRVDCLDVQNGNVYQHSDEGAMEQSFADWSGYRDRVIARPKS